MGTPREGGDQEARPVHFPFLNATDHGVVPCRYDPINFVEKWSTPMLIIHGSKDYRLPETDGIGGFNALQQCAFTTFCLVMCAPGCLSGI